MSSLRGKITLAYSSLAFIVLILCGIAVSDLLFLETQVHQGVAVSDLKDAVLEMRRQEKNLFLYADSGALSEADDHAAKALKILGTEQTALSEVSQATQLETLDQALRGYRDLLKGWHSDPDSRSVTESLIREKGQGISSAVDGFARLERKALAAAVRKARGWLLLSILAIGMLVYLVGRLLARAVTAPLRHLESHLMPIAEGRFDHLEAGTRDREFVAFADAFNRMLKELDARRRRLLQSEKLASLGTLAAGVAHELNNPLSNISSSCQLLQEELGSADSAQLQTWLQQIDSETERARRIVLALLEYGRQRELDLKPVHVAEVLANARMLFGSTLRGHAARLHTEVPGDLMVTGDSQRLHQVFINLVRNALDAGGDGVHIRITAAYCANPGQPLPDGAEVLGDPDCRVSEGRRFAEITVEDDGPGIAPEVLRHIFDPFFTTREPGRGMGLGLYIIQEIIKEHAGCIAVTSTPGKGTRITLRLPSGDTDT
jgi:two-component system NtrC family sensor kinase